MLARRNVDLAPAGTGTWKLRALGGASVFAASAAFLASLCLSPSSATPVRPDLSHGRPHLTSTTVAVTTRPPTTVPPTTVPPVHHRH